MGKLAFVWHCVHWTTLHADSVHTGPHCMQIVYTLENTAFSVLTACRQIQLTSLSAALLLTRCQSASIFLQSRENGPFVASGIARAQVKDICRNVRVMAEAVSHQSRLNWSQSVSTVSPASISLCGG